MTQPIFLQSLPAIWHVGSDPDIEHGHERWFWVTLVNYTTGDRFVRLLNYVNFFEDGYSEEELENWDGLSTEDGEPFFHVGWTEKGAREGWHDFYVPYEAPKGYKIVAYCAMFAPRPAAGV